MTLAELATRVKPDAAAAHKADAGAVSSRVQQLVVLVALAAVYYVSGKLGLRLAFMHPSSTAVWPPSGIALAATLVFGRWVWPGIFAGAFLVNLTTAGDAATSLAIAAGNTLEPWVACWLLERFNGGADAFDRAQDVFKFTALAAVASTMIAATIGASSLTLAGYAAWPHFRSMWTTWWLGDATSMMVLTPLLLLWSASPRLEFSPRRALEAAGLVAGAWFVGMVVFGGLFESGWGNYPLEFLCTPLFIWAAFRFDQRAATVVIGIINAVAVASTLRGRGPFIQASANESLMLLQGFSCVAAVTTLALAAVVHERRQVQQRLQLMAVSDSLTGLGNYRHLMDMLEREIQRSWRTGRTFAVLFLDLDKLKKINDKLGHLAGSRCLWRVGEVLRRTSRSVDTAARYGGDEFALILPESDAAAAEEVADRIRRLLRQDPEQPPITVSTGVAVYPRDGTSVTEILAAADRAQYAVKGQRPKA